MSPGRAHAERRAAQAAAATAVPNAKHKASRSTIKQNLRKEYK